MGHSAQQMKHENAQKFSPNSSPNSSPTRPLEWSKIVAAISLIIFLVSKHGIGKQMRQEIAGNSTYFSRLDGTSRSNVLSFSPVKQGHLGTFL